MGSEMSPKNLCRLLEQDLYIDPEAVAYKFYGWLRALCVWLAGLTEHAKVGYRD